MRILITGSDGFLGTNLRLRLRESGSHDVAGVTEETPHDFFVEAAASADFVFHLAGVNRPKEEREFAEGNTGFTETLCGLLAAAGRTIPVVFTSSTQAELGNSYGRSKLAAEAVLLQHGQATGSPIHLLRLTNIFGKWSRPNYNSAVATFCYNLSRGLPIVINDPIAPLHLVYVDDVMATFMALLAAPRQPGGRVEVEPIFATTVGEVADILLSFTESRASLSTPRVGTGLTRALYATYLSFLPPEGFAYEVPRHRDPRGEFVEMLKTPDCGQFSYFTAHPGITRGEHYHHSKTEKFLVIRGSARFGFRQVETGATHELITRGGEGRIVETVPGWTHNITNIGDDELIVMLWANEIFDPTNPDTFPLKVDL
jgi:UDP-2-acetamido-2,6-beta-L-arabino-hexul-4-ose reductase